jgi:hypothetical protein
MTDLDRLDALFTLLDTPYDEILSFIQTLDNDDRQEAAILADRLQEALTETRVERGAA